MARTIKAEPTTTERIRKAERRYHHRSTRHAAATVLRTIDPMMFDDFDFGGVF